MLPTTNFPGAWPNQKNGSAGHFWVATQQLRNTGVNKIPVNFDPHRSSSSGAPCPTPRDIWTDVGRSIRRRAAARRRSQRRPPLSPPPRSAADNNTHTDTEKVRGGGLSTSSKCGKAEGPVETRPPARRNSQWGEKVEGQKVKGSFKQMTSCFFPPCHDLQRQ